MKLEELAQKIKYEDFTTTQIIIVKYKINALVFVVKNNEQHEYFYEDFDNVKKVLCPYRSKIGLFVVAK